MRSGSNHRRLRAVRRAAPWWTYICPFECARILELLYHPASFTFHKPERDDDTVLQLVEVTDSDSKSRLVLFSLERQDHTSWRIGGCIVSANHWRGT